MRDAIGQRLIERFVAATPRVPGGENDLGLPGQNAYVVEVTIEDLSDLLDSQSGVALQNNDGALVVSESAEIRDDRVSGGNRGRSIDQLDALPVLPWQMHGCADRVNHRPDAVQARLGDLRPTPVELCQYALHDTLGLHWITREEIGRGHHERTFSLSHSGVLLITDRRHASPSLERCWCKRGTLAAH